MKILLIVILLSLTACRHCVEEDKTKCNTWMQPTWIGKTMILIPMTGCECKKYEE